MLGAGIFLIPNLKKIKLLSYNVIKKSSYFVDAFWIFEYIYNFAV